MEYLRTKLLRALFKHFDCDDRRIEHALRALRWTETILETEQADPEVAVACALLHDVGIKVAEERHGTSSARLQEEYGPDIARQILAEIDFPPDKTEEVCSIVGKHHTKNGIDSNNFRVLWDSDLLVNTADSADKSALAEGIDRIFTTEAGRRLARIEFGT